jgi:nocturnin
MSTITVAQFNTLAEALSNPALCPNSGFTSLPPEAMSWPARGDALVAHVQAADADVVCLQEVDHYRDTFYPRLRELGYEGCFREDEWSPCRRTSSGALRDGVAIFYRADKLELCGSHVPFVPRERKDVADPGRDAGKCLIARFRLLAPRELTHSDRFHEYVNAMEELVVACAHLDSKKDEEGAAKRRLQAMAAASEATRFRAFSCTNPSTVPILFVGDLNATPDEPAVRWLKQSAQPRFFSAYERADGAEPRFTTWKIRSGPFKPGEAKMCIDYVMASEGCEVVDVRKLAGEEEIGEKGLPCATHPSDHLLLRATIRLGTPPRREESQPANAT